MDTRRLIGVAALLLLVIASGSACLQGPSVYNEWFNPNPILISVFDSEMIPGNAPSGSSKVVGKNDAGFQVIRYEQNEGGVSVYSYEIYDPVLKKSYPAVNAGNSTVSMSDHGEALWKKDRGKLPREERYKGLTVPQKNQEETATDAGTCFSADTQVLMGDSSSKPIAKVRAGDIVKSYNTVTGKVENKKVIKTYIFPSEGYYLINGSIKATAKHPFLMAGPGEIWKKANKLSLGDRVKTPGGQITVESIEKVPEKGNSYNFRVADNKAYIVSGLEKLYVVHNGL